MLAKLPLIMQYLAKEWADGRVLQLCQILLLIHLNTLQKNTKPLSLSDLLKMSLFNNCNINIEQIISKHDGVGTCLLLDSYDGWHWNRDFIHDLIFKAKLHSSVHVCALTSCPFREMVEQSHVEHIQIIGFSSSHLDEYLHTLSKNDAVTNSILDLWERNHNIKEIIICELPLYMIHCQA